MAALGLKIEKLEKKIARRQELIFNYDFLVRDYYPQVIGDLKRWIDIEDCYPNSGKKEEEEDISEDEE